MSEELYFDVELRRLLDGIGFSDCGENDEWNFWYQRVHKAHDQTIDRVTEVQRAENANLRERITTQKQTIQAYRDESREWREVAERAQAENVKLKQELEAVGTAAYLYGRNNLVDENAKLQEKIKALTELASIGKLTASQCTELAEDNAKLRELVRDMLPFVEVGMDDTCVARRCCLFEQCEYIVGVKCAIEQHMLDRMRELGIDLDDGTLSIKLWE